MISITKFASPADGAVRGIDRDRDGDTFSSVALTMA
jgi:hypothetical protein